MRPSSVLRCRWKPWPVVPPFGRWTENSITSPVLVSTSGDGFPTVPVPWSAMTRGLLQWQPRSVERAVTISRSEMSADGLVLRRRSAKATSVPFGVTTIDGIR